MINKKYFKKIAAAATVAALLFQVQPAVAADIFDSGEAETAAEELQEPESVEMTQAAVAEVSEESGQAEASPVEIEPVEIEPINIDIPAAEETASEETASEAVQTEEPAAEAVTEITEAAEEEPAAEETEAPEAETPAEETDVTESEELQQETSEYKTDFLFENDEVKITATAVQEAKLPQNTEMKAVKLEEGTAAYEEAKAASAKKLEQMRRLITVSTM